MEGHAELVESVLLWVVGAGTGLIVGHLVGVETKWLVRTHISVPE